MFDVHIITLYYQIIQKPYVVSLLYHNYLVVGSTRLFVFYNCGDSIYNAYGEIKIKVGLKMKQLIKEYSIFTLGTLCIACGIFFFKFPNHFSTGGVSGLAVVFNYLFPSISSGNITIILNVSMLVLGFLFVGKSFSIKTVYCSLLLSGFLYILEHSFAMSAPLTNQPMLELCFAVLLSTIGEALLLNYEGSSGGTDIIAMILKKYTSLRIGKALFAVDAFISIASGMCYGIQVGLFSFLGLIAKSVLLDKIVDCLNLAVSCILITNQADSVCDYIIKKLHRGTTIVDGNGGFTGYQKKIIITVLKGSQLHALKKYLSLVDKEAFLITSQTSDIYGKGFHTLI